MAAEKDPEGFYSDQFHNLANFEGHKHQTGPEIYEQLEGNLDIFIAGAGTGGTIAGVSHYLKSQNPSIKVFLADPQGSSLHMKVKYGTLFSSREKEGHKEKMPFRTMVEGVGLLWLAKNFDQALIDDSVKVSDQQAYDMARFLLRKEGLFVGSSSALHIFAACKVALTQPKGTRILTLICDDGGRHLSKFYEKSFWDNRGMGLIERSNEEIDSLEFLLGSGVDKRK